MSKKSAPTKPSRSEKAAGSTRPAVSTASSAPAENPRALLFADLDSELTTTRRFLDRVPNGKDDWRPHAKSRSLGELATHVAQLPGFGILMLTVDEYAGGTRTEPKPATSAERVQMFDEVSGELRRLVGELTWDRAMTPWTLKFHDRIVLSAPRAKLLRSAFVSHLAHHRAQLGVYLRMLDVPVPGSYGASADEGPTPQA